MAGDADPARPGDCGEQPADADGAAGGGRHGAADCMRQCREPAAGARGYAAARDRGATVAGRAETEAGAATAYGKHADRPAGWRPGCGDGHGWGEDAGIAVAG